MTRVGLDATPLLGARTGVGRYTGALLSALAAGPDVHPDMNPDELVATTFTLRGAGALTVPDGVRIRSRAFPANALQLAWAHSEVPPVELLAGRLDVFHATTFVLPPLWRARGVVTIHDLAFLRLTETVTAASARYRALVPRSIRRAAVVLTPSEAVADQVREAYAPTVPVLAIPHGVDPGWAEAAPPSAELRARLQLPDQYVLFVGTLEPRKDLATLLAAHRLVPGAPPLVLVGPPGWGARVDVSGCVTPGYLDDADLRPIVRGASALVLPSRDEGFGLPVLEALAAGTPVVASDLPVLREVGGNHVRYATVGDAEAFADALGAVLGTVLADPGDRAVRQAHAAGFTWAAAAMRHRQAYRLAAQI